MTSFRALAWMLTFAGSVAVLGTGCPSRPMGAREIPLDARVLKLSLHGLDCAECGAEIASELLKVDGVYDARFSKKHVVMTVFLEDSVDPQALIAAVKRAGFTAEVSNQDGSWLPQPAFSPDQGVDYPITDGSDLVDLESLTIPGKITVLDLYTDWCKPCRSIDEHVKHLLPQKPDLRYRKLDVIDWDSPLAVHHLVGVKELPYVLVYDRNRKRVDVIAGLDLQRLDAAIATAEKQLLSP